MKKIKMVVLRCHVLANTTFTATCIVVLRDAIADAKIGRFIKNSTVLLRPTALQARAQSGSDLHRGIGAASGNMAQEVL
jgi:hypothetical protein